MGLGLISEDVLGSVVDNLQTLSLEDDGEAELA